MSSKTSTGCPVFDKDFRGATHDGGAKVSFTRYEAATLRFLSQRPNRVVTRGQIQDEIAGEGSDGGDRNVDLIIKRLRRKLGDSARNPRMIATRYGEGYVWIAEVTLAAGALPPCHIVIGPVLGLEALPDDKEQALGFVSSLRHSLEQQLEQGKKVIVETEFLPEMAIGPDKPELSIALKFFKATKRSECVLQVRSLSQGGTLLIERVPFETAMIYHARHGSLAYGLLARIWKAEVTNRDVDQPLQVAMAKRDQPAEPDESPENLVDKDALSYGKRAKMIEALRRDHPNDPVAKLMQAALIHNRYVQFGFRIFRDGPDSRSTDEDLIEELVMDTVPHIRSNPEHALVAAKLLYFIGRGYREAALDLAEGAFTRSTSIASSLVAMGQLRAFDGDPEGAISLFDQAISMTGKGSQFRPYALLIKCEALLALSDRERLDHAKRDLYALAPATRVVLAPLLADPEAPSIKDRTAMLMHTRAGARPRIIWLHYVGGRLFRLAEHREGYMGPLLTLSLRRFGPDVLPEEAIRDLPSWSTTGQFTPRT